MRRAALTLLEILIALAIILILFALLLPAVQLSRETARRTQCSSNLRHITIGMLNYETSHNALPPGSSRGLSLHLTLLPFLGDPALSAHAESLVQQYGQPNVVAPLVLWSNEFSGKSVSIYRCPSDEKGSAIVANVAGTNYGGNSGTGLLDGGFNGVFHHLKGIIDEYPEGVVTIAVIADGTSQTVALSEMLVADGVGYNRERTIFYTNQYYATPVEFEDFCLACIQGDYQQSSPSMPPGGDNLKRGRPWTWGDSGATWYNHSLPPGSPNCNNQNDSQRGIFSAGSHHSGGVYSGYVDGHVNFTSSSIDRQVWRALGSRNGGEVIQ